MNIWWSLAQVASPAASKSTKDPEARTKDPRELHEQVITCASPVGGPSAFSAPDACGVQAPPFSVPSVQRHGSGAHRDLIRSGGKAKHYRAAEQQSEELTLLVLRWEQGWAFSLSAAHV